MTNVTNPTHSGKQTNFSNVNEIDLREIFAAIVREKKLLSLCVLLCLSLSLVYLFVKVPRYESDILIQVQDKQSSLGSSLTQDIASIVNVNAQISPVDVQKSLITSRFILDPVIQKLGLDVVVQPHYLPILNWFFAKKNSVTLVPPRFGTTRYAWGGEQVKVSDLVVPYSYEKDAKKLKLVAGSDGRYKLYSPDGQGLLEGKVGDVAKTENPNLPHVSIKIDELRAHPGTEFYLIKKPRAKILDALSKAITISDLGTSRTGNNTGILQIALIDTQPQRVVDILNTIARLTVEKDIERKSEESEKTYKFIEDQLPVAKRALDIAETKMNHYRAKSGKIDLKLESQLLLNQLSSLEQNIGQLKMQRAEMQQDYTAQHPFVTAINDKIKGLEKELNQMQSNLKRLPASDQIAVSLMRDVDVKNQLYLLLLNKLQEVRVLKAGTISDVRILSLAEFPDDPIPMNSLLIITAGALLGLMLGMGIILLRKAFKQYVEDPYWIEQALNINNLAIVPHSKIQNDNVRAYSAGKIKHLPILAAANPTDMSIESLRSLRTSLQFIQPSADNNKIISITGVSPSIGKSFISANLAYVLADQGKKVLLIDGDIRKGHMHDYFARKRSPGLTEALNGKAKLDEIIAQTHKPNLYFLPCGAIVTNPSELLLQDNCKEILEQASNSYDAVIIDTAPILAVTDAILVAKHAGINLLVLGASEHSKQEIEIAVRRLGNSGVTINGAIFNNKREQAYVYGDTRYHYSYS